MAGDAPIVDYREAPGSSGGTPKIVDYREAPSARPTPGAPAPASAPPSRPAPPPEIGPEEEAIRAKFGIPRDVSFTKPNFYDKVLGPIAIGTTQAALPEFRGASALGGAGIAIGTDLYEAIISHNYDGLTAKKMGQDAAIGLVTGWALPQLAKGVEAMSGAAPAAKIVRQAAPEAVAAGTAEGTGGAVTPVARIRATLEAKRQQIASEQTEKAAQQMIRKTPEELHAEEADPDFARVAQRRADAQSPFFSGAKNLHDEIGKKFEPYIGPVRNNAVDDVHRAGMKSKVEEIEKWASERGYSLDNSDLKEIFARIKGDTSQRGPTMKIALGDLGKIDVNDPANANLIQKYVAGLDRSNPRELKIIQQAEALGLKGQTPLTWGKVWGDRVTAGRILSSSRNPAVRYAAKQFSDDATEALSTVANVPQELRNQYSTERSLFPPALSREVAQARNPQEVGEAIFGSKATPNPAQIPLQIIRRADAAERDGLKAAFADRYLGNHMGPEDLAKMNPEVITELYGKDSDAVFKLLGTDSKVKSASWQTLMEHDPQVRESFNDEWRKAVIKEVGKIHSRPMERVVARRPIWIGMGLAFGGYKYLLNNPYAWATGLAGGTILGGRALVRYALRQPGVAGAFVDALNNPLTVQGARKLGSALAGMTVSSLIAAEDESGENPVASAPRP